MKQASPRVKKYMENIDKEVLKVYDIVKKAKAKGYDPDKEIKVPLAKNMAERVEGLISTVAPEIKNKGVVERIAELEKEFGSQDWRVALKIAEEVAIEKFCKFENKKKAIETGIRVGFSYVTVGVVSSPLEGFVELRFHKRKDNGKEYFCLMYSGPTRSAGGTAASVSVLIADYVRKKLGYATYDATEEEIKRSYVELCDYNDRVTNLQYFPSQEEVEFLMKNIPVQLNGDPSEKFEVSNYKDLDRIETNRIRNGFCLISAECLCLKAPKLWKKLAKWGHDFEMEHWDFMKDFVDLQKKIKAKGKGAGQASSDEEKIKPDFTFVKDLVAGRPVLGYPLRNGAFRLRYGRSRISGFSSDAIHPASMVVMNDFIGVGTQLRTERPGKSTTLAVCDTIDGPIVKLKDGTVIYLETEEEARKVNKQIDEILYLGDILINYGDFLDRAHKLIPCGFVEEWWVHYLRKNNFLNLDEKYLKKPLEHKPDIETAIKLSEKGIPLHPKYIFYWNSISKEEFIKLYNVLKSSVIQDKKIIVANFEIKRSLELIGISHKVVSNEYILIENDEARALLANLGNLKKELIEKDKVLEMVNELADYEIKDKCGYFIGTRMGRPEKAKMRKLIGSPHVLFPVGEEGGRLRCFQSSLEQGKVTSHFPLFNCDSCGNETILAVCEKCGAQTQQKYYCRSCKKDMFDKICPEHGECEQSKLQTIDIKYYFGKALDKLKTKNYPSLIKGVRGLSSKKKFPEHLVKGILRSQYQIHVNKEGTVRYDMTEMACTHFKPVEIGTSIAVLKKLGYEKDIEGKELINEEQILELLPQDVILPACEVGLEEGADAILYRTAQFLDDELKYLYGLPKYYNIKSKQDLAGHLIVAMSPHTSAGIISRIIGFSKTQGFLAHPLLHSIMRRDCDGDEAGCMLLMDCLLNFSRDYLPNTRGVTQDAPLVLTSNLIPAEVDDMVFNMDIVWEYPLEFYEAAENYILPWECKVDILENYLGTERQYEGYGFTHNTTNFNKAVMCSQYKLLPTMKEKVLGQMEIARRLRGVDEDDVARLIIERHFMRDIKGNLRKFSMQKFRCVKCNESFRRPPLIGKCTKCGGKIIFTIHEGSVVKYVAPAMDLAEKYNLPKYLKQTLILTQNRIESVFGKDSERQEGLQKWFT